MHDREDVELIVRCRGSYCGRRGRRCQDSYEASRRAFADRERREGPVDRVYNCTSTSTVRGIPDGVRNLGVPVTSPAEWISVVPAPEAGGRFEDEEGVLRALPSAAVRDGRIRFDPKL
ncbi:hypothetical protein [Natronorarus salvus]|uniref:hypothetical protein n=1 Tax=Natronorarus salvus TaxID=3117733 RepID=UPI002F2667F2